MVVQGVGFRRCRHPSFEVSAPRLPASIWYTIRMEKRVLNKWLVIGRKSGFGIGFDFSIYWISLDLGFWFISVEL
jgi:hypothetical protein